MSVEVGKEGKVSVDVSGTVTAIAEVEGYTFDQSAEVLSRRVLGFSGTKKQSGNTDATGSIDMYYDPADGAQNELAIGATVALTLFPQGDVSGKPKLEFDAIISSLSLPVSVEGFTKRSASFEMTGALTEGVVA